MKLTDLWATERQQLTNACDALYEAGLALLEFAHDNGPLGDPDVRVACLRALSAGEVARGAGLLAAQAVELLPKPTVTDDGPPTVRPYDNGREWCCDNCGTWNRDFHCDGCDCDYESWLPTVPTERVPTTYDCGSCGGDKTVSRTSRGPVASVWVCSACNQQWVWDNSVTPLPLQEK